MIPVARPCGDAAAEEGGGAVPEVGGVISGMVRGLLQKRYSGMVIAVSRDVQSTQRSSRFSDVLRLYGRSGITHIPFCVFSRCDGLDSLVTFEAIDLDASGGRVPRGLPLSYRV